MSRSGLAAASAVDPPAHLTLIAGIAALLTVACPGDDGPHSGADAEPESTNGGADPAKAIGDEACSCNRPATFADAVERVRPAVVNLYAAERGETGDADAQSERGALHELVPNERLVRSLGSGVIIDSSGLVVSNHHVVEGTDAIRARLLDDRWFETEVVGSDPETDIALLRLVDADDVPTASLGDSSTLAVGDWVVAIGNPLGLNSTVTAGIASGIGRSDLPLESEMRYQDFIQTDASINPGNSGGPLVDADGDVVGINTVISAEGSGIGFAIPSAMIRRVLPRLKREGGLDRSWLGLYVDEVPDALREQLEMETSHGVLVTGLMEDGPAAEAGLRSGDVILEIDGETIEDVDQVSWVAGNLPTDRPVEIVVQRGSDRKRLEVTPADQREGDAR